MTTIEQMQQELQELKEKSNLRKLPAITHEGRNVIVDGAADAESLFKRLFRIGKR